MTPAALTANLRRGLAAGLLAGLVAGVVAFVVGEPPLRDAVHLEQANAERPAGGDVVAVGRSVQEAGLIVATGLVGVTAGGLFGLVFSAVRPRLNTSSGWTASLQVGAAAYAGVALMPSLKYPPNPPAVGDPATVSGRTGWYLLAVGVSLAVVVAAWDLARRLRLRGVPHVARQLLTASAAGVGMAGVWALPAGAEPTGVPAALLWDFRLSALATQLVLWAGTAVAFGLLSERASEVG